MFFPVASYFLENGSTPTMANKNHSGLSRRTDRSWIALLIVLLAHLMALAGFRTQPQPLLPETLPEPIMVSLLSAPQTTPQKLKPPPSNPKQKMQRTIKPKTIERNLIKRSATPIINNKSTSERSQNASQLSVEPTAAPEVEPSSPPNAISSASKTTKPDGETSYQPPSFDASYLHNPAPNYPSVSRRLGEQGRALLRVQVRADGTADAVALQTSSGSERLDQAALDAVIKWRFVPAKRGGQAISATVVVPVRFSIEG